MSMPGGTTLLVSSGPTCIIMLFSCSALTTEKYRLNFSTENNDKNHPRSQKLTIEKTYEASLEFFFKDIRHGDVTDVSGKLKG